MLSGSSGIKTPSGYEFLDLGSDVKRAPRSFEWEWWADWSMAKTPDLSPSASEFGTPVQNSPRSSLSDNHVGELLKRRLGPNEVSYYLSSRGAGQDDPIAGVNDMYVTSRAISTQSSDAQVHRYLHVGFSAPPSLVTRERLEKIWTELRLRHTLLASTVEFETYEDVRFVFKPHTSFNSARDDAAETLTVIHNTSKEQVLNSYLNGNRTLSDDKLAALIISTNESEIDASGLSLQEGEDEKLQRYEFFLLATHFLGDGMALHTTANEFFDLLGGKLEACEKAGSGLEWNVETGEIVGRFSWRQHRPVCL